MGTEHNLWERLRKGMSKYWLCQRIEDRFSAGIPDLMYVIPGSTCYMTGHIYYAKFGFLELKRIPEAPKRPDTIVKIPHDRHWKIQQAWAHQFGAATRRVFLLLQVGKVHLLFDHAGIQQVGKLTFDKLEETAVRVWEDRIDYAELSAALS